MRRRKFMALAGGAAAWSIAARAGQTAMPVMGLLALARPAWVMDAIHAGLKDAGYEEGRNLTVVDRSADGQFDRLPALADNLVRSQVDAIFATGSPVPARLAKAATTTIPIVFAYGGDPVADGLVDSLNHPGGNVTGATFIGAVLLAKRMETIREIVPRATEVALLVNPQGTLAERQIEEGKAAAAALEQHLHVLNTSSISDLDVAFETMAQLKIEAFIVSTDPFFGFVGHDRLASQALRYKIPGIYTGREEVDAGGLISYGPDKRDTWRQAAIYVGRILKGEKPSDLPVTQPTKFELVINLKAANEIGLTIPPTLLSRADMVIE
jgi:putative tryptophan/tyrosine transport system substrate-binding protein